MAKSALLGVSKLADGIKPSRLEIARISSFTSYLHHLPVICVIVPPNSVSIGVEKLCLNMTTQLYLKYQSVYCIIAKEV